MTTTALPTTGLDVIGALDFQPDLPCEGIDCPLPADVWITQACRCRVAACCGPCVAEDLCHSGPVDCLDCHRTYASVREGLVILGPVRA